MKKVLALLLVILTIGILAVPVMARETEKSDDIVILYTNDVHTYIDKDLSYDVLASVKKELQQEYEHVLLVDAGDHIQGTAYGSMDDGKTIIDLMNAAGYDAAALGNHEFDYGMDGFWNAVEWAEFPYVSCNFYHTATREPVVEPYELFECGDRTVAIVGIATPDTGRTYFRDTTGKEIYSIDLDGEAMYNWVQGAVDEVEAAGADTVIALAHLGTEGEMAPWRSTDVIANTDGLDAVIDGHSHFVMERELVKDRTGKDVLLTQTGSYFDRIGMMVVDAETGAITTELIEIEDQTFTTGPWAGEALDDHREASVKAIGDALVTEVEQKLGIEVGKFDSSVQLTAWGPYGDYESAHLTRLQETNSGDFCADALYYLFDEMELDVDVAVTNGGGMLGKQKTPITGAASYITCKDIHPYGNVACLISVKGQQILDALEWGARLAVKEAKGSFLQVSGLKFKLDVTVENTTQTDASGMWSGAPTGDYRVYDVQVFNKETNAYEPLDLNASYNLAGYNYILRNQGDGFGMFTDAVNVLDYVMEDYMVLANYIQGFDGGVVKGENSPLLKKYDGMLLDYSKPDGCGRIVIEEKPAASEATYTVCWGDTLGKISKMYGCTVGELFAANRGLVKNPNLILVGWELVIPQ